MFSINSWWGRAHLTPGSSAHTHWPLVMIHPISVTLVSLWHTQTHTNSQQTANKPASVGELSWNVYFHFCTEVVSLLWKRGSVGGSTVFDTEEMPECIAERRLKQHSTFLTLDKVNVHAWSNKTKKQLLNWVEIIYAHARYMCMMY